MSAAATGSYLAFDLGASNGRAILGRLQDGVMEMEELHRFETPMIEEDGHLYWDAEALWEALLEGLAKARNRDAPPRSLSVDAWGVDYVPLDRDLRPVRRPYAYRDPRTAGMIEIAARHISREEIYAQTGIQFMPINTLDQVLADLRLEPDEFESTHSHLLIADYFNFLFSGRVVAEVSLASTTQLMKAGTREWAESVMRALGMPPGAWPEIVPSGTPIGPAIDHPDIMVVAGCSHDTACAVAAAPAAPGEKDWAYISCGTWSLLGVELSQPVLTSEARTRGFTNEAGFGDSIRFLKNVTGLWLLQECERGWRESGEHVSYPALVAEARAAPAPSQFIDVNDPRFAARGDMEGRIREYCRERGLPAPDARGDLVRLIIDSLAEGHRVTLEELEAVLRRRMQRIYMVGGGSQNELLCQATADRCRRTVIAGPSEATALGNLLVQAHSLGDLSTGTAIREVVRASSTLRTYEPKSV